MATFPTIKPSTRTYTPGDYPHSSFVGISGVQNRVRNSSVMLGSRLRLSFVAISESQMLSLLAHYQGQRGGFLSFSLPEDIWSGASSASDYQLAGYGWRYVEPPSVTDSMCADAYEVSLTLESVAPEGTAIAGFNLFVNASIATTTVATASGLNLTVTTSIQTGGADVIGSVGTVTVTFTPGAALATTAAAGLNEVVAVSLQAGAVSGTANAAGLSSTVTVTIAGGTASGTPTDPSFSSVSLLLHMDGANNSTTFTDSSSYARSITRNFTVISTAQSKFGGASGYFDGTASYIQATPATALQFSSDFTIEMWVYPTTTQDDILASSSSDTNTQIFRLTANGGSLSFYLNGTSVISTASAGIVTNQWQHLALCRSGSSTRAFVNGIQKGSTNTSWTGTFRMDVIGTFFFNGTRSGNDFTGYIDDVRITKGVARYTADFTPPTAAFPDS